MKLIAKSSRSVTLEIENDSPYYLGKTSEVLLNGVKCKSVETNVFSLFGLAPQKKYAVSACGQHVDFTTESETAFFNVSSFGAVGNGITDDTSAFTAALACLPYGGTLYVPAGNFLLSPVFLGDGQTIYLEEGATLIGKPNREEYPLLPAEESGINLGTWQGEKAACFASLITAVGKKNIKIVGSGTIDCNALAGDWYNNHRIMRTAWRPRGVFFNRCENVLVQGVSIKNTPSWNVHPYFCKNVSLCDLHLYNPPHMPTTDGVDPDCCDGVNIIGADISVGDDCIAIKSGTLEFAKEYKTPCKNVVIRNCVMRDGHGGVVLGSELSGGIENVDVEKCLFVGTDRGLRIKTRRGRGCIGPADGITFTDITMRGVKVPFVVNMYYNMGDDSGHTEYVYTTEKLPVDERTPHIGSFTFRNMRCEDVSYCAGAFYGLPEAQIEGITFDNVSFTYDKNATAGYPDMKEKNEALCRAGLYFQFVKSVRLNRVNIAGADGNPVVLDGVEDFKEE